MILSLWLGAAVVLGAVTHSAAVSIGNTSSSAYTGRTLALPFSGTGLDDFQATLRRIALEDSTGAQQLVEARTDNSAWRVVVPSIAASSTVNYTLDVDNSVSIDAFGCSCWATTGYVVGLAPGTSTLDITATVIVDDPHPYTPTSLSITTVGSQYPSSRRVASIANVSYVAYIVADGAQWDVRVRATADHGVTWVDTGGYNFDGNDDPIAVSLVPSADLGFLFLAVLSEDTTANEYEAFIGRGTIGDPGTVVTWLSGDGTTATMTSIATQASTNDPVTRHGIIVTNTGGSFPAVVWGWHSAIPDTIIRRYRSTVANSWSSPNAGVAFTAVAGGQHIVRVDCGPWNVTTEVACVYKAGEFAGTNLEAIRFGDAANTAIATVNASTNRHNFSVVGSTAPRLYIAASNEAAAGNATLFYEECDGTPVCDLNAVNISTDAIRPTLTQATRYTGADNDPVLVVVADSHNLASTDAAVWRWWTDRNTIAWSAAQVLIEERGDFTMSSPATAVDWDDEAYAVQTMQDQTLRVLTPSAYHGAVAHRDGSYGLYVADGTLWAEVVTTGPTLRSVSRAIADGRRDIRLQYDGVNLTVTVDGASTAVASTGSVVDAAQGLTVSYGLPGAMDVSLTIGVGEDYRFFNALAATVSGGTTTYSSADIVGGLTATVQRFHTTHTPSGVSVVAGPLIPASGYATSIQGTTESVANAISGAPATPAGLFGETGNLTFPLGDVIQQSRPANIPVALLALTFAAGLTTIVTFLVYRASNSVALAGLAGNAALWVAVYTTPLPLWVALIGLFFVLGILLVQRQMA